MTVWGILVIPALWKKKTKMNKKNIPLISSFKCAVKGIVSCIKSERNFRIHLCALFYIVWFSSFYDFSRTQKAVLALTIGFVIACEMLNTAIEADMDLTSPGYNRLAGLTKDIAAGAVLVAAITAVVVAFNLLYDREVIDKIVAYYLKKPLRLLPLALSAVAWVGIIFIPSIVNDKKENKKEK